MFIIIVKIIFEGKKIMQDNCDKWIKYRYTRKNANMGSSAIEQWTEIYLYGLDMRGMKIQN